MIVVHGVCSSMAAQLSAIADSQVRIPVHCKFCKAAYALASTATVAAAAQAAAAAKNIKDQKKKKKWIH